VCLQATKLVKYRTMKLAIVVALISSVAAFTAPLNTASKSSTALNMAGLFKPALKYVPCIPLSELPKPGSATSGIAGGLAICIAVDKKGSVYALGDKCPPVNQPLSFGKVNPDGTIQDPVLGTKFSLKTGDVVGAWCPSGIGKLLGGAFTPSGVPTYPVRQRGGSLEVQVDVNYKANFEKSYWTGVLDAQGKSDGTYY
jgi:nitrite reductase/ring-hydroxylating ferredoxin subunit